MEAEAAEDPKLYGLVLWDGHDTWDDRDDPRYYESPRYFVESIRAFHHYRGLVEVIDPSKVQEQLRGAVGAASAVSA